MSRWSRFMKLYYIGSGARITDESFESFHPAYRSYPIRELEYIHVVRRFRLVAAAASTPLRVCSIGVSGLACLTVLAGWPLASPGVSVVGIVLLGAAAGLLSLCAWARRRPMEIRAVYRGQLVLLFATTDCLVLAQVGRALLRVLDNRPVLVD